ncbi:MAG: hypothetical protein KC684_07155 [Candidatus Omnitrophica bacterium]|nr:hypothetical protein [Candidatus Omnitrophota bacterium]
MSSVKIKQIKLRKFRGATDETTIDFDCQKHMVVIFGENGTGKTTILDSVDFACNQCPEVSLKNKSVGKNKYKYLNSLASKLDELEVEVTTSQDITSSAKLVSKGEVSVSEELPPVEILRRDSILKIVTGQPKERFNEIRNMVSFPRIKQMEDALRLYYKNVQEALNEATKEYQQAETALNETWKNVGNKEKEALEWAKERSAVNKDDLEKDKNLWEEVVQKAESLKLKTELLESKKSEYVSTQTAIQKKKDELQENVKGEAKKEGLVPLLEKAKDYIENHDNLPECPVCSNNIQRDDLLADISSRIDKMKDLKRIQDELSRLEKDQEIQQRQIKESEDSISQPVADIKALFDNKQDEKLKNPSMVLGYLTAWKTKAGEKQKEFNQIELIQLSYKTYCEKKEDAENSSKKSDKAKELLDELERIRKAKVDGVLKTISTSVERMYIKVHPNEGIGAVKFYLDAKKAESLEFDGDFQGSSVPPQAYYSESHLDTLGVCIFLALAQYKGADGILLLDDVLTSVDQQHMDRIINMLEEESGNFGQIIISTHYRPWRDKYRMPAQQKNNVELIELLPWSSDAGVRHTRTKFFVDEIRDLINEQVFNRQSVASKAGVLLEHILDEVVLKYSLRVPRRPVQKYTLNELFNAIDSQMRKLLKITKGVTAPVQLQQNLTDLHNSVFIRNEVGGHYNETGALLSDDQVKDFGSLVVSFAELMLCDTCGAFPNKNKSGSYWECGCGQMKLEPLVRPGGQLMGVVSAEEAKA